MRIVRPIATLLLPMILLAVSILAWRLSGVAQQAPTSCDPVAGGPQLAAIAPDFALPDLAGQSRSLSTYCRTHGGARLVFFCGCDRCRSAATRIGQLQRLNEVGPFLCVFALDRAGAADFVKQTNIRGTFLLDPSDTIADRYSSLFCPRLWVLRSNQLVAYKSDIALEGDKLEDALRQMKAKG
jgi:hypothetical protein